MRNGTMDQSLQFYFADAISAVKSYQERVTLTRKKTNRVNRLLRSLERLDNTVVSLMEINNQLLDTDTLIPPQDGMVALLQKLHPDAKIEHLGNAVAYNAGADDPELSEEQDQLEKRMEDLLESFYSSAFRMRDLIRGIDKRRLKNHKCIEITLVRNQLIEHPSKEHEDQPYSFSFSSGVGPSVSPISQGRRKFLDKGLMHNVAALNKSIAEDISKITPSS
jgi:hypothetical protein